MTGFLTRLKIEELPGGKDWRLLAPLVYRCAAGYEITVPAGATTDFASVPWGLWNLLPKMGEHNRAAVLHDCLYRTGAVFRAEADSLFLEAMKASGVSAWKRWIMWGGVRVGGRGSYRGQDGTGH